MIIKKVTSNTLIEAINDRQIPILVIFSRENCHVCQEVVPKVEDISKKYEGKISFYYVDVETDKSLFKKLFLRGVPQLVFFKNGELCGKLAGNLEEEDIEEKINDLLM
jgi:thioredoxin 1